MCQQYEGEREYLMKQEKAKIEAARKQPIKIDIYSDLHLDSWKRRTFQKIQFLSDSDVDLVIVAGDNGNGQNFKQMVLNYLKDEDAYSHLKDKDFIIIDGNHDFYFMTKDDLSYENLVTFYKNASCKVHSIKGLKILTAPLWTNFRNSEIFADYAESTINDFLAIPEMTAKLMKQIHDYQVKFLLDNKEDVDIVVTHFPPLLGSEHPMYAGDNMNPYFVNDLPELVEAISPRVWIHGHTHSKFDYVYKKTRVVANPIGYYGENQRQPIFTRKRIEI